MLAYLYRPHALVRAYLSEQVKNLRRLDVTVVRYGHLPDEVESVFHFPQTNLEPLGVKRFTPLGVIYCALHDSVLAPQITSILDMDVEQIRAAVARRLKQLYPHSDGQFVATRETAAIVEEAVRKNGVNTAGIVHLLHAMLTISDENDGRDFLQEINVTASKIEEVLRAGKGTLPAANDQLAIDGLKWLEKFTTPVVEFEPFTRQLRQILACLGKRDANKAFVWGLAGVGRRTLVRRLIADVLRNQHRQFKDYEVRVLDVAQLVQAGKTAKDIHDLLNGLPAEVMLVLDNLNQQNLPTVQAIIDSKLPVIGIFRKSDNPQLSTTLSGKGEWFEISEPKKEDLLAILKAHIDALLSFHGLTGQVDEKALGMLIDNGPVITDLENPGGAIFLADFVCSYEAYAENGNNILEIPDIAAVVSARTGVPMSALTVSETDKLARLDEILSQRIVGQPKAKLATARSLKRRRVSMGDGKRPIGVFIFLGPTGVGKTEFTKALAFYLFGDEDAVIRLDMSEYQEKHTVARMIGSPPGYVGYNEGGQLTEAIRSRPYSIINLDEIDKAHPDVLNVLLQLMDEGRLTDGKGRTVNARHTIIVMTSNHGSSLTYQGLASGVDQDEIEARTLEWLRQALRPEFLNRVDEIIYFHALNRDHAAQIFDILVESMLIKVVKANHNLTVYVTEKAKQHVVDKGYSLTLGARPLRRAIEALLVDPIVDRLINGSCKEGDKITINFDGNKLTFTKE